METLEIRKPDDMHVHLRQDKLLPLTVKTASLQFARGVVMPNLVPPVDTADKLTTYRGLIKEQDPDFEPLMTFQITAGLDPGSLPTLKAHGAVAGKLYPQGVTTNSQNGWNRLDELYPVFEGMQDIGMILSMHGENPEADVMDRELWFLPLLKELHRAFPRLRMILEHISRSESVELISRLPSHVGATITVHHMLLTHNDLCGGVFRPHLFCKPVLQPENHRKAVAGAAFSGNPKFFFGSDSAPHLKGMKESSTAAAGVFSAPVALPLLFRLFEEAGAPEKLEAFVSQYGAEFYRLPLNRRRIELIRESWIVPEEFDGVVPLWAGQELCWKVGSTL